MLITYTTSDFTNVGGLFYSPSFLVESKDDLLTIAVELATNGTVYIEASIDDITWYTLPDTFITTTPSGLESYADCQPLLLYRLQSPIQIISAKILI